MAYVIMMIAFPAARVRLNVPSALFLKGMENT